jgi:type IV pilus assembly protein PilX
MKTTDRHANRQANRHANRCTLPAQAQTGVAMLMALVMLLVVSLGSSALLRSALNTDDVALGTRLQLQARQAAELALRYCEQQLIRSDSAVPVLAKPASGSHWQQFANWFGTGRQAVQVPPEQASSEAFPQASLPECLAEEDLLADGAAVVLLTARGFSPDYRADAQGRTLSGSVVWLQAILQLS